MTPTSDGRGNPFEQNPLARPPLNSDDDLTAEGEAQVPGVGTYKGKVHAPPGGPLEAALASVPTVGAACAWMVAAGWTFGRAIEVNNIVAACLAAVPAVLIVTARPAIASIRAFSDSRKVAAGQAASKTPAPVSPPPASAAVLSQADRDAAREPWRLITLQDDRFAVVNGGPTEVYDVHVLGRRVQSEGTHPVLRSEGQVSFRDNKAPGEDARVVRVLWRPAPGEDVRVWLGSLPPIV